MVCLIIKKIGMKKPEIPEIVNYLTHEKNYDDFTAMGFAEQFWHFYESKGWLVGKTPMKSWKSAIRTWELKNQTNGTHQQTPKQGTSAARINTARNW